MTTDEKLKHFTAVILESTHNKCEESLEKYKEKLDIYFEEHKSQAIKNSVLEEHIEAERIRHKSSRDYSAEQLRIRRKINDKQVELKERLLNEVKVLLEEFFTTENYVEYLIKQIDFSKKIAREESIFIYIDAKDKELVDRLEKATETSLIVDGRTFYGGIKAEIPEKNILIDKSFESKLENWMETYLVKA